MGIRLKLPYKTQCVLLSALHYKKILKNELREKQPKEKFWEEKKYVKFVFSFLYCQNKNDSLARSLQNVFFRSIVFVYSYHFILSNSGKAQDTNG